MDEILLRGRLTPVYDLQVLIKLGLGPEVKRLEAEDAALDAGRALLEEGRVAGHDGGADAVSGAEVVAEGVVGGEGLCGAAAAGREGAHLAAEVGGLEPVVEGLPNAIQVLAAVGRVCLGVTVGRNWLLIVSINTLSITISGLFYSTFKNFVH